ncbi:MAG: Ig-like domain-containing protein [Xanthobacteraceae bacterium]
MTQYASVANLTFIETTEIATQHAELRYAESDAPSTAWGYFPSTNAIGGDVWFNQTTHWYDAPQAGNYAFLSMIHETGHTLGLKHPHNISGVFGAMPVDHDSLEYTVMSYRSFIGASLTSGYTNEGWGYPQTLMMYDVAAIQEMYGANYTTNSGNTVYKWNPLTGQESINGVAQAAPGANKIFMNVWDGGGHDTYDFSNYTTNLKIDLHPGAWTITSTVQLASLGGGHLAVGNISNSLLYHGNAASLIEDAIGGTGNDTITGNAAANALTGGHGNDVLDGDLGTDTAIYSGARSSYQLVHNTNGSWTITDLRSGSPDGVDTLTNIEQAQFSDQLVVLSTVTQPTVQVPTVDLFSTDSGIAGDRITNDSTLTFSGTGTAGSTVMLYDGTLLVGSAVVSSTGAWTVTTAALSNGPQTFTAVATNAGVTSATSAPMTITIDTVAPALPTISGFSPDSNVVGDHVTNATTLVFTGAAEAGSKVQVFDGTALIGSTMATAAGAWSFTVAEGNGGHHLTVTATDAAGNTSAASVALDVTVDTVAPNAPVIASFSPDTSTIGDGHTTATALTLVGTAEANSTVKIYDGALLLGSAKATAAGAWSIDTAALATGAHAFSAIDTDVAGNSSATSAALAVTIDPTVTVNQAPVVTAADVTAARNQTFAAASLFTVSDANHDPITHYQFFDNSSAANSGHFVLGGVAQPAGAIIDISASQLALTSFVAGAAPDSLSVRAFDGTTWSVWDVFHVTAPNSAPVIMAPDVTTLRGTSLGAASLFSVSDADHDAITGYQFVDYSTATNSGHFVLNGVAQASGIVLNVSAAQLAQMSFTAGAAPDTLSVRAFDGIAWGAWDSFHVTAPDQAPVIVASDITTARGASLGAASLFSASDADHDAITAYQFVDYSTAANSGHFVLNGVAQASGVVLNVSAAQLAQMSFTAGAAPDYIGVRAFDGVAWSNLTGFHVSTPNQVPVVTATDISVSPNQVLAAAPRISATDADHDPITAYEFWDSTATASSGHFVVNGIAQAASTAIDVAASQVAQVAFDAGTTSDSLMVRASDGIGWGAWAAFKVNVPAPAANAPDAMPAPVNGGIGNAAIISTAANEVMTGKAGSDTFVFGPHIGQDIVTNFTVAGSDHDVLAFSHSAFSDVAALLAHAAQAGPNVVISIDAANSVTIDNVTTTILQQHPQDIHFLA